MVWMKQRMRDIERLFLSNFLKKKKMYLSIIFSQLFYEPLDREKCYNFSPFFHQNFKESRMAQNKINPRIIQKKPNEKQLKVLRHSTYSRSLMYLPLNIKSRHDNSKLMKETKEVSSKSVVQTHSCKTLLPLSSLAINLSISSDSESIHTPEANPTI